MFCESCKKDIDLWTGYNVCDKCKEPKVEGNKMGSFNDYDEQFEEPKLESASSFRMPDNFKNLPKEDQEVFLKLQHQLNSPYPPPMPIFEDVNTIKGKTKDEIQKAQEEAQIKAMSEPTETEKIMKQIVKQRDEKILEDLINKPNHYHFGGLDIYELLQAKFSPEYYKGFCLGNILKYVIRHQLKGGVKDLEKAEFNLKRLIEAENGIKYIPDYKRENK